MQQDLKWLLDRFTSRIAEVKAAVLLSEDGLVMEASGPLEAADAEHVAALAAGYHSLSKGVTQVVGGGSVIQTFAELPHGFFMVAAAGSGTCLAVIVGHEEGLDTDFKEVAYEMEQLAASVGHVLSTTPRASEQPAVAQ
ncbi:MAG: roadblock/LC7 domain-containing protein [Micromonosporaceae bacterium]